MNDGRCTLKLVKYGRGREREKRGSGLEGRSMFPGIIGQPGLRTRYEMQARPSRVGLEFLGLLLMWMRYPERRSELGRSIESSHAWRGLQMSEDPKRRSEANARKTAFAGERLKEGGRGRVIDGGREGKKERKAAANDFSHAVDGCERGKEGREECLIGCTDSKQAAAYSSLSLSLPLFCSRTQRSQDHKDHKDYYKVRSSLSGSANIARPHCK